MFSDKGSDCAHLLLCCVGWRASLHAFLENNASFSLLPGAPQPPGVANKGSSVGPSRGWQEAGWGGKPVSSRSPQLPQADPGRSGP